MNLFEPKTFRTALGQFATGVTIITARGPDGKAAGVTSNSFNSVSLDPPLILWSLAKTSRSMPVFEATTHFAVHVLASNQAHLSNHFASRAEDKFTGMEIGAEGPPLIADCAARFLCKAHARHEGGDHIILIGEVEKFDYSSKEPLLFHGGQYADITCRNT